MLKSVNSSDKLPNRQTVPISYQPGLKRHEQVLLKGLHPAPALCVVSLTVDKVLEHPTLLSLSYTSHYCQVIGHMNTAGMAPPCCTALLLVVRTA